VLAEKECANRVYDGSLVMGNLMLAAHALGIGSCWIHRAKQLYRNESRFHTVGNMAHIIRLYRNAVRFTHLF